MYKHFIIKVFMPDLILFVLFENAFAVSVLNYQFEEIKGQALICIPDGKGSFPAVVYNHGKIVDILGYKEAIKRGYDLKGICQTLANDGFLAFIPIRSSGKGNIPGHKKEVSHAVDYIKNHPKVDPSKIALMGFSRGGLLTLMVGVERNDLQALIILAPAPGRGHFAEAVQHVSKINVPVLLLVETGDSPIIIKDYEMLEQALRKHKKEVQAIRYNRGGGHRLFWSVGYYWKDVRAFLYRFLKRD